MGRRKRRQSGVDDNDEPLPKLKEIPLSQLEDDIERELIEHAWYSDGDEEDDYSEESYP